MQFYNVYYFYVQVQAEGAILIFFGNSEVSVVRFSPSMSE